MERLENDADLGAAHERKLVLAEPGEIVPGDRDVAARCALQAGDHHQQGCLARARWPDDGKRLPRLDLKAHVAQDLDRAGPARQRELHVLQGYDGLAHVAEGSVVVGIEAV